MSRPSRAACHTGFTMIELLTVIAIIAILAAIIFPVFSTVRENGRQTNSLSNMHQISTAISQFELDTHKSPSVLFGYVFSGPGGSGAVVPMDQALATAQADGLDDAALGQYFPGLYPEYINDVAAFTDPNNPITDFSSTAAKTINVMAPCSDRYSACTGVAGGTLVPVTQNFYVADAFDLSPQVTTVHNTLATGTDPGSVNLVPRYQAAWTDLNNALDCNASPTSGSGLDLCHDPGTDAGGNTIYGRDDYARQLHWHVPPSDAYVTCTTYHVPFANRVLVLWAGGSAKSLALSRFLATGEGGAVETDVSDIGAGSGTSHTSVSPANFWKCYLTRP